MTRRGRRVGAERSRTGAPPDGSILRPRSKEELREGLRDLDRRLSRIERPAERGAAFGAFRRRPAPPDPFVSPRPSRRPLRAPSSLDGRARRPSAGRPRLAAPVAGKVSARSCRHGHPFRRDCRRSCRRRRPARGRTGQGAHLPTTSGVTPGPMTVTRCRSPTAGPRGALSGYPGGGAEARSCSRTRHCGWSTLPASCRQSGRRRVAGVDIDVASIRIARSPMASSFRRPAPGPRLAAKDPATGHRTSSSATLGERDRADQCDRWNSIAA